MAGVNYPIKRVGTGLVLRIQPDERSDWLSLSAGAMQLFGLRGRQSISYCILRK